MQNCFLHRGVFCRWSVFTGQERLHPVCGMDLYALPSGAACSIHLAVMIVEYLAARWQVKRFQRAEDLLVQVHDLVERPLGGRARVRGLTVQRSRLTAENPFLWACHRAMGNTSFRRMCCPNTPGPEMRKAADGSLQKD